MVAVAELADPSERRIEDMNMGRTRRGGVDVVRRSIQRVRIEVFLQVNPAAQASFSKPAASAPDVPLRSPSWRGLVTVVLGTGRMGIPDRSAGQGAQLLCRPSELRPGARHRRPRR
jgi:hypothetical protein